jgi:transcriptional regulator with XRE-family HTH domain
LSLTAEQLRASRALLKIGVRELAERAGLDKSTIVRIESGSSGAHPLTLKQLRQVLEDWGIEFIDEIAGASGPGARLKWDMTVEIRKRGKGESDDDEAPRDTKLAAYWAASPDRFAEFSDCGRESIHKTTHSEA